MLKLKKILGPDEIAKVGELIEQAEFVDGSITGSKRIKDNLQVSAKDSVLSKITQLVQKGLNKHPTFGAYVRPFRMVLNVNRYEVGMRYDTHNDAGLMDARNNTLLRTDLSMTLFLTAPDTYDGGELVMMSPYGEVPVKLPLGDAVVYPSNMLHRVEPITRGVRVGAFCWIQSQIRDEQKRLMVYRLDLLRRELAKDGAKSSYVQTVGNTFNNLLRMWSDI